ncbi:MAG TPA: metal ABC transporter permease [Actinomycetota bacterium]
MSALTPPYPFDLGFMQRALVASLIVGVFAPMIGTFLVQKRLALIGDGIGHVAFAGVGAGLLVGIWPVWTALAFAVAGALGVEWLRERRRVSGDVALALLFYSGIALGVVLVSAADGLDASILGYLFGQPLTVTDDEIVTIAVLGAAIVAMVLLLRRALFAVVTDDEWSRVAGLPSAGLNSLLAVATACGVVAAMRVVGILLVAALMVLPVASGQLLARSFRGTLAWSVAIGVLSVVIGLTLTGVFDLAPGGAIVLVAAAVFGIVAAVKRSAPRALRQEEHG